MYEHVKEFVDSINQQTEFLDNHRASEPPDPIPNSEVKSRIADGSVGVPM